MVLTSLTASWVRATNVNDNSNTPASTVALTSFSMVQPANVSLAIQVEIPFSPAF
jgi:hypothetical protein